MVRRLSGILFFGFAFSLLAGCNNNIKKDYVLSREKGKGVIILSTTESGKHCAIKPSLLIREVGKKYGNKQLALWNTKYLDLSGDIAFSGLDWFGPEISEDKPVGNLHAIELPAGQYEFYSYAATVYMGNVTYYYSNKEDFSWKFRVEPGVAKYLGNVNFHNINWQEFPHLASINNESTRDIKLFEQKYKNIPAWKVRTEIIRKSAGDIWPRY